MRFHRQVTLYMPHLLLENVLPQNEGPIAVPNNEMSLIDEVGLEIDM
jgi:hypothetical protein